MRAQKLRASGVQCIDRPARRAGESREIILSRHVATPAKVATLGKALSRRKAKSRLLRSRGRRHRRVSEIGPQAAAARRAGYNARPAAPPRAREVGGMRQMQLAAGEGVYPVQ